MQQHVSTDTTTHYVFPLNLHLNSTALVHFTNGSYPYTLPAGPAGTQTCVNISTLDDRVQGDNKVFNVSIQQVTSTGGVVKVGTPSTAQVTIIDSSSKKGVLHPVMCVMMGSLCLLQLYHSHLKTVLSLYQRVAIQHKCVFRSWKIPLRTLQSA